MWSMVGCSETIRSYVGNSCRPRTPLTHPTTKPFNGLISITRHIITMEAQNYYCMCRSHNSHILLTRQSLDGRYYHQKCQFGIGCKRNANEREDSLQLVDSKFTLLLLDMVWSFILQQFGLIHSRIVVVLLQKNYALCIYRSLFSSKDKIVHLFSSSIFAIFWNILSRLSPISIWLSRCEPGLQGLPWSSSRDLLRSR